MRVDYKNIFNIYRAPRVQNEKYCEFIQEISPLLVSMEKENSECIVTGDCNIDLPKINEKALFSEFFDTLTENTFYNKITLPTRFINTCGTLIDNLYCKLTENTIDTTSGILIKIFSDHQPYFTFWNTIIQRNTHHKFIKINTHSQENINSFKNELIESDWMKKYRQKSTC